MSLPEIILKLKPTLMQHSHIHAMWLEGSYATGRFRDTSDIDVWLDVSDGRFDEAYETFRTALESIDQLRQSEPLDNYSNNPKLAKAKFYLKDKSDDQRIELDMQEHSRKFTFSRNEHDIVTVFDKDGAISWRD